MKSRMPNINDVAVNVLTPLSVSALFVSLEVSETKQGSFPAASWQCPCEVDFLHSRDGRIGMP